MVTWRHDNGTATTSERLPADPGLMGCGHHGGYKTEQTIICIRPMGHEGAHRYEPILSADPIREFPGAPR